MTTTARKWIYSFAEGDGRNKMLLGGKGANLCEMTRIGLKVPPGYHAHLGLLYLNAGKTDQALAAWQQEKNLFPESTKYIDFLISNMKKSRS